jgi:hypothetical protein
MAITVFNIHPNLSPWASGTYAAGSGVVNRVSSGGHAYQCTTGGLSTSAPTGQTAGINNGGVAVWKWLSAIDYTSQQAWADAMPATQLASYFVANWNNGEVVVATGAVRILGYFGKTAGFFQTVITTATGESIRDQPSAALAYNPASGVAFRQPAGNTEFGYYINVANVTIDGIQTKNQNSTNPQPIYGLDTLAVNFLATGVLMDGFAMPSDLEIFFTAAAGVASLSNFVIFDRQAAGIAQAEAIKYDLPPSSGSVTNGVIVAVNGATPNGVAIKSLGGAGQVTVRNVQMFGYASPLLSQNFFGSIVFDHCITDVTLAATQSPTGWGSNSGAGNLFSKTAANQFISATTDLRPKIGAESIGNGAVDLTDIPTGVDFYRNVRGAVWDMGPVATTFTGTVAPPSGTTRVWSITPAGQVAINGTVDPVTSGVAQLILYGTNVTQLNAAGNYYTQPVTYTPGDWGVPSTTSPLASPGVSITTTPGASYDFEAYATNSAGSGVPSVPITAKALSNQGTGTFKVSGGQILKPDGTPFKAQGWSCLVENLNTMVTNAACQPLTTLAPFLNIIGITNQTGPADFASMVNAIDQVITWMTAKKIVVVISSYTNALFNGQGSLNSGQLATDVAMFGSLAAKYASNPYVWFLAGPNEGVNFNVSPQHWQYYQAIRNAGNNNPIGLNCSGGYTFNGMDNASGNYTSMTNVWWSFHPYAWEVGGQYGGTSEGDTTGDHTFLGNFVAAGNWIQSKDGVIPCMAAEFGNANGNSPTTINGGTLFNVVSAYTQSICVGWMAWLWFWPGSNPFPPFGDDVVDPNNTNALVSGYGDVLVANMSSAHGPS